MPEDCALMKQELHLSQWRASLPKMEELKLDCFYGPFQLKPIDDF